MIHGYIKLAFRNLGRHRLYALINIAGLALGLTVFLFSFLVVNYENNHDGMFSRRDRIYAVGSNFTSTSDVAVREYPVSRTAYGPLIEREVKGIELVARAMHSERLLTFGDKHYYAGIRFVDPGFTRIFDFKYIQGDKRAVDDAHGLILTESTAGKIFGRTDVLGRVLSLEHKHKMRVAAVIKDVAPDSHFNSSFLPKFTLTVIAPVAALVRLGEFKMQGDWETLDAADMTYVLLPKNRDGPWLEKQVNAVAARHAPRGETEYIRSLKVRPLIQANIVIWAAMGFPLLETVRLLGLLVLLIACVNYANLATAGNFSRTREVGLRKTFGAERRQLLTQFLVESLTLAAFAMLLALACVELLVPFYNDLTGKALAIDYAAIPGQMVLIVFAVGLAAGAYPAYLISRISPLNSLRNIALTGPGGSTLRGLMIAGQFCISTFILAMVLIIYFQNEKVLEISNAFPKSRMLVLDRMDVPRIKKEHELLRRELKALGGVRAVTYSSGIPFSETSRTSISRKVAPTRGGKASAFSIDVVSVDAEFMKAYEIEVLAGRSFDLKIKRDVFKRKVEHLNVVINRLAARELGFGDGHDAVGKSFYKIPDERNPLPRTYTIIGLMPDLYFIGPQSKIRPMLFMVQPDQHYFASVHLNGQEKKRTLREIDATWRRVIKGYPMRAQFLGSYFGFFYRLLKLINTIIAVFAGVALALALTGLFGLSAFLARRRTKEIGIRKVMGASVSRIVFMLVWRFSKPVLWSLVIAMPLAYLASGIYLDFFPERFGFIVPVILAASAASILSAWAIVAGHAVKVARGTPIRSLRYE